MKMPATRVRAANKIKTNSFSNKAGPMNFIFKYYSFKFTVPTLQCLPSNKPSYEYKSDF